MSIEDLDVPSKDMIEVFSNGQETVQFLDGLLNNIPKKELDGSNCKPFQPIALVLLDINMPILNGFETLKLKRAGSRPLMKRF